MGIIGKVIVIGEALIDFIAVETETDLSNVSGFVKSPGGAPANVAACVKKLGGEARIITKLGQDPFGDFLADKIASLGIDGSSVFRTDKANTALAFVSLKKNGERDFSFYRNPSADMLLEPADIDEKWFETGDILHFCSIDLVDAPVRKAHDEALRIARKKGVIVSFDPNVRLPLWKDKELYREVINEYAQKADVLKISDDELEFITGTSDVDKALRIWAERARILVYTKGTDGAQLYAEGEVVSHSGFEVAAVDTTGAGDAFIGSFLFSLVSSGRGLNVSKDELARFLEFSNAAAAITTTRKGAVDVMPDIADVKSFITRRKQ